MDWEGGRESSNVEDQRSFSGTGLAIGGGGIGTVLLVVLFLVLGGDPSALFQQAPGARVGGSQSQVDPRQDKMVKFVKVILGSTEDVWTDQFPKMRWGRYRDPKLVLFRGQVQSACGLASAAVGPFYCPGDQRVYLDLEFFDELKNRFHAPGDFANAYVIAHEVGHHVQKLRGISDKVDAKRRQAGKVEANRLSVRLELQADFLAGVWGHHARQKFKILQGDVDAAIRAAGAIGDDRLQMQSRGTVVPDSFTHGTSEQRIYWFRRGFETGDPALMDELFQRNYKDL